MPANAAGAALYHERDAGAGFAECAVRGIATTVRRLARLRVRILFIVGPFDMSASNHNWVCFDCHFVKRQPKTAKRVPKCPECGSDCFCLGYKVEIPKKSDTSGWSKLRAECQRRHLASSDMQAIRRVREAHTAERQIARLRTLGPNKDREKIIAKLNDKVHAS